MKWAMGERLAACAVAKAMADEMADELPIAAYSCRLPVAPGEMI
jgi:hypothetical protein